MFSTRAGDARPVRIPRSSCWRWSIAFSMCISASSRTSSTGITNLLSRFDLEPQMNTDEHGYKSFLSAFICVHLWFHHSGINSSSDFFAADDPGDIAVFFQVEHHQRDLPFHAQRDRRQVHHAQLVAQHLLVAEILVELGGLVFLGVGRI